MEKKSKTLAQRIDSDKAPLQPLTLANLTAKIEASAPPWLTKDGTQWPMPRGPPQLWRLPKVLEVTGLKKSQLFDAVARGKFPAPVKILESGRAIAWLDYEVIGHVYSRLAAREGGAA
jgi:prophage regulatory protein